MGRSGDDRPRVALASGGGGEDLRAALTRLGVDIDTTGDARLVDVRLGMADPPGGGGPLVVIAGADDASLARALRAAGLAVGMAEPPDAIAGALQQDLPRAIAADEIDVLFQPQVSVADGTMIGVEALARWRHPQHGEIGAAILFSTAARCGLTAALSRHVQQRALTAAAGWPASLSGLRVAINVSASEFAHDGFVSDFTTMVEASGMSCDRVTVELTESELALDLAGAARMLDELRASACRVAIDDFGTGYSSLAYLKALPVDYLKIDKELAQDIAGSPRDRVVVRGVIELARSLGIAVIAEGVETGEQLALLAAEGCQFYQGYHFAPALSSEALAALVSSKASPVPSTAAALH